MIWEMLFSDSFAGLDCPSQNSSERIWTYIGRRRYSQFSMIIKKSVPTADGIMGISQWWTLWSISFWIKPTKYFRRSFPNLPSSWHWEIGFPTSLKSEITRNHPMQLKSIALSNFLINTSSRWGITGIAVWIARETTPRSLNHRWT